MSEHGGTMERIFEMIDGLRERGVTEFEGPFGGLGSMRVVLGPPVALPAKAEKELPPGGLSEKVGRDGLNAEEQLEYYGAVVDPTAE